MTTIPSNPGPKTAGPSDLSALERRIAAQATLLDEKDRMLVRADSRALDLERDLADANARVRNLQAEWNRAADLAESRRKQVTEQSNRIKELTLYSASLEQGNGALFGAACGMEIKLNPLLPENVIAMRDPVPFPQILAGLVRQYRGSTGLANAFRIAGFIIPEAWIEHQQESDQCYGNDALCTEHLS